MKARVLMIGDYDGESKTYAIGLTAEESEVDASPLKDGDEVEIIITPPASPANTLLHLAHLEALMDRVAKTLDCLPSYADSRPDGGNAHIIRKLNGLTAEIELWRAGDIVTPKNPLDAREGE